MDTTERQVVLWDFYGPGEHIYEDQLGWNLEQRAQARSNISKEIFKHHMLELGLNMTFYYIDADMFIEIFGELEKVQVQEPPRDKTQQYKGWESDSCSYFDGRLLYEFENDDDVWDGIIINGVCLEDILERSFIMEIC